MKVLPAPGAMMSGFETSMTLTLCQTHSLQINSNGQQPQCNLPSALAAQPPPPPGGLNRSGADPPLSSSRACLTTFIANSVP